MRTELWDLAMTTEDLLDYLDNTELDDISREKVRDLVHELNAAYVNYADSVDKAAVEEVL